eukprot:scaffold80343_cov84-Phaeocystis_antarctica.AAC.1
MGRGGRGGEGGGRHPLDPSRAPRARPSFRREGSKWGVTRHDRRGESGGGGDLAAIAPSATAAAVTAALAAAAFTPAPAARSGPRPGPRQASS